MSKTHGLIPISNPDRSLPLRNPYPSLPINPSTIPKRPPIILIVKFHSIGATFTRHFVNGSFSKVDPLRIPYWNRKFARRIARFGTILRGATRDARDKSARVQRGKRWTTVQGLFSPGRRRTLGGRDSLWWRRNRWTEQILWIPEWNEARREEVRVEEKVRERWERKRVEEAV